MILICYVVTSRKDLFCCINIVHCVYECIIDFHQRIIHILFYTKKLQMYNFIFQKMDIQNADFNYVVLLLKSVRKSVCSAAQEPGTMCDIFKYDE